MAAPVVNPSPKARFMDSPQSISAHKDMIATRTFERACDFALLEYQARLGQGASDFNHFAANGMKMQGALEFLMILRSLGETAPLLSISKPADNLSHHG